MKHLIILLIIINASLFGQAFPWWWDDTTGTSYLGELKHDLYAVDFDGSTEYASKTTPELILQDTLLNETFADGDYTSGNVWTVSSGSYAVTDTVSMYSGGKALRCATAGIISIPLNQAYGSWEFDLSKALDASSPNIYFINNKSNATSNSGYRTGLSSLERTYIARYDAGSGTNLLVGVIGTTNDYVSNRFKIVRNTNGAFSIYAKGGTFGSEYTLISVSSGTNPVTDNTYTQSNYFVLDLDAGDAIGNILCISGSGSLDLNGHELTKYPYQNSSFEGADTTYFTSNGTHSIDTTSTYKQSGSYGAKVISGGVGDTTTNFVSLTPANYVNLEAGKKYTVEYWPNAVGKEGTAAYTSNFGAGVDGWTLAGGTATYNATISDGTTSMDSVYTFCGDGVTVNNTASKNFGQNATNSYWLKFWYLIPTSNDTITKLQLANVAYTQLNGQSNILSTKGTWRYYSAIVKADGAYATQVRPLNASSVRVFHSDSFYIANVSMTPIVQPTYTLWIGSKSSTSDTISIIPGVFEKFVYNFEATTAEVGATIKLTCSASDTTYIDNFSITEAKDATYNLWAYNNNNTSVRSLLTHKNGSTATATGTYILCSSDGKVYCNTGDGTFGTTEINTTYPATSYYMLTYSITRTDSIRLYKNGVKVASASVTGIGKITSGPINVGKFFSSTYYHLGKIGEIQIVRGYAMSQADITENYLRWNNNINMKSTYSSGEIVFWQTWEGDNDTEMANDKSDSNNDLTLTNITLTSDRVVANPK